MDKKDIIKKRYQHILESTNGNKKPIDSTSKSTLIKQKKANDGSVYAIIKEENNYYIKVNKDSSKENLLAEDFNYIGGLQAKPKNKYPSYNKAVNMLNLKVKSINEDFSYPQELNTEEEIPKHSELEDVEKDSEEVEKKTEPSIDTPEDNQEDVIDTPETDTPEQTIEPSSETELKTDSGEESPKDDEGSEDVESTDQETDSTEDSDDSGEDSEENREKEVLSLLGKISGELSRMNSIEPDLAKNAINTIISSTSDGIENLSDKEKDKLAKRIERDGEKIEESINEAISQIDFRKKYSSLPSFNDITKFIKKNYKEHIDQSNGEINHTGLAEEILDKFNVLPQDEDLIYDLVIDQTEMYTPSMAEEQKIEESDNSFVDSVEKSYDDLIDRGVEVTPEKVLHNSYVLGLKGLDNDKMDKIKQFLKDIDTYKSSKNEEKDLGLNENKIKLLNKIIKEEYSSYQDENFENKLKNIISEEFEVHKSEMLEMNRDDKSEQEVESIVDDIIKTLKSRKIDINLENVIIGSLFQSRGTITNEKVVAKILKDKGYSLNEDFEFDHKEESDDEYYEIKVQDMIEKYQQLEPYIDVDKDIPAWIQAKLTMSMHNADAILDYYRSKHVDTEDQEDSLNEDSDSKSTDLDAAKDLVSDLIGEEKDSLNENVLDRIKKFSRPVILAAFISLMAGNVDGAVEKYSEKIGEEPNIEMVDQAKKIAEKDSAENVKDTKEVSKTNKLPLQIPFADNQYKLDSSTKEKLNGFIKEYASWKSKQSNSSVGDDIFIGIIGRASTDVSKQIADMKDQETAKNANEYLAKLRAKAIFDYITIGTTKVMRDSMGVKNFKFPDKLNSQRLGSTPQAALGYKVLGEDNPNQSALVFLAYGDEDKFSTYQNYFINKIGTRKTKEVDNPETGAMKGQIHSLDDFTNNSELVNLVKKVN